MATTSKTTKTWPEGDKTAQMEELTRPLRKAFEQLYTLQRINEGKNVRWNGLPLPKSLAHILLPFEQRLTATHLEKEEEKHRDALDVLLDIAVQLGYEQGRRQARTDLEPTVIVAEAAILGLKKHAANLKTTTRQKVEGFIKDFKEKNKKS